MVGFGSQPHNWVAAPDSAEDEDEFPAYAEPIERSDTDYYYDFESDQLRGAWPSKTTMPPVRRPVRVRQPTLSRWPSKADPEGPQQPQPLYGDYTQSQEKPQSQDYRQSQDYPQSQDYLSF